MAVAEERLEIGIRRHFTEAGRHPYDQVTWERRDSRISDYRTGEVAFEQLDVEVPSSWSMNATNILAQKYFRGSLGTPEREWSLRQVIDRVVDTITAWGTKDGYFADAAEAAAFSDELKHLIVEQKAAFNSPVWFNIGVKGVPQQASACQPYDALVSTLDGLVPIGELVEANAVGRKVFDAGGVTTVVAVKQNGRKHVLRITTKSGHQLDVTADHLVWRASGDRTGSFVPAGDLRPGDMLSWHRIEGWVDSQSRGVAVETIEDLGEMDVYDIQTDSGEYLSGGLRVHNCFILAVEDSMSSILNWYVEEGTIFKGGSGSGVNLSNIRSSRELLHGGGTASGPVSFMRGADASAGTIKSGGKTRRAAKMVILDADHPDIREFVWCKAREERKARVLAQAGFDMDLDGVDSHSTQYQNANNSVRVSDAFMRAVLDDADWQLVARTTGEVIETVKARDLFRQIAEASWECADPGLQYDTTINKWHTAPRTGRISASNPCSEYVHLDNSSCNLASLNLLRFVDESDVFDVAGFRAAVAVVFTAQEILIGNADYPTEKIAETTRAFRELGLGYANLGALLMAMGVPYDSDEGRAWAAAITALMTGSAYEISARTAARMGPFAGYHDNTEPMLDVLQMHRAEVARIDERLVPVELFSAARECWDDAVELAGRYGVRNSQASVLAPTGCLVGGTLVPTSRGLVRLRSLGDPGGAQWQGLDTKVATDEGTKSATRFYVNGLSPVADVRTRRGYRLRGTPQHRVKIVDPASGIWAWRHLSDLREGDLVPLALSGLVGSPQQVPLPPASDAYWTSEHDLAVPRTMTPELAELVGYYMGDGSLHARGIRFCVGPRDLDVVARLGVLCKEVFGLPVHTSDQRGYTEVRMDSVRLVLWWEACGFAKTSPTTGHSGKGYEAHVPDAVLHSNDRSTYASFMRGLFEADGDTSAGYPTLRNTSLGLVEDVQSMLLALGFPTTVFYETRSGSWGGRKIARLRLLNLSYGTAWLDEVGFIGVRKSSGVRPSSVRQGARCDVVPVTRSLIDRLAPANDRLRKVLLLEHARTATVSRRAAMELWLRSRDEELGRLLGFFYDRVASTTLESEELTYDLSVPENVTYVANGFVSHNTISFLMDCDTTGIEPDLGLVKTKKLVGGGTMSIVNQTVPRALRRLGYSEAQVEAIIAYIDEHKSIVGAPAVRSEHMPVFACSMGDNVIHYLGHVRMMAAAQPFISGAISKSVNMPEEATIEEIEKLHIDAWQMGLKSIAIYRDNCKVAQPLATTKLEAVPILPADEAGVRLEIEQASFAARETELTGRIAELEGALQHSHVTAPATTTRTRLPRRRRSNTFAFRVADCEGYVTVGEYEDGRPGEVFMKVSKQGSTLSGVMDAFSIAVSLGLQHGVPVSTFVRKYTNMRFEPAGITDDSELRLASSLVDYIFRRLALDYLSFDERLELGVLSTNERTQPTLPGLEDVGSGDAGERERDRFGAGGDADRPRPADGSAQAPDGSGSAGPRPAPQTMPSADPGRRAESRDAPFCYACGNIMQRAGSCYACPSCGATSGCS